MLTHFAIAVVKSSSASRSISRWFLHLGGVGLIPLGLLDSSVIPVPGSMDVVTIILAAHDQELWPYYALMATIGSVVGGYTTYRLAHHHGGKRLEQRVPFAKMEKFHELFRRWGFGAIAVPAILPPPMPMVPFLLAAGASSYSLKRFLTAFTLGRAARFGVLGYLGARYGRHIVRLFALYGDRILYATLAITCAAAIFALVRRFARKPQPQS